MTLTFKRVLYLLMLYLSVNEIDASLQMLSTGNQKYDDNDNDDDDDDGYVSTMLRRRHSNIDALYRYTEEVLPTQRGTTTSVLISI